MANLYLAFTGKDWHRTNQLGYVDGPKFKNFKKALAAYTRPTTHEGDVVHIYINDKLLRKHSIDALRRRKLR